MSSAVIGNVKINTEYRLDQGKLNVSHLPAGWYVIEVRNDIHYQKLRFIKN